ncbi:family 78 glycoside hydrolase catalytic domain [Murimonas intestini]|uniref:family 78 glycoside hydrolase catalytic domain n=1 Tax=Murimonas intestini TaxID=1337051 RepID=UPI0016526833|nr:family 78 glycoside hydrolase catalytic domain [Murimonas intestini]
MGLIVSNLKCDHRKNPLGIDSKNPLFSWELQSDEKNVLQSAYQITVKSGGHILWDTGRCECGRSAFIRYEGENLKSGTVCVWELTVWDNHGNMAAAQAEFETAFMNKEDWKAKWIEPVQTPAYHEPPQTSMDMGFCSIEAKDIKMQPAQMVRKEFILEKQVRSARAYATAHGVYYMLVNGQRVSDIQLAPGNTAYGDYLEYQTYDISSLLQPGSNAVGMVIGDGWYVGKVGIAGQSCQYGDMLGGLFQLEITYEDGSKAVVVSDEECTASAGHIQYADIYVGECHDAGKEQKDFSMPGFGADGWKNVTAAEYGYENLRAQYGDPVRVCDVLKPVKIWTSPKGEIMLDVGQVVCGHVRMRVKGAAGTKVVLDHTETIDREGNYQCNIIGKLILQQDVYILKGEGEEVFEPEFTFHGFRYIRVSGYPGEMTEDDFDILVINSDMERTGRFTCSDSRLNQLAHNIYWSQRGNMLSIPTDCPQREKAGWTGDAQIFAPTACFNMDVIAFLKRWLANMRIEQREDGQIPNIIPYLKAYHPNGVMPSNTHCSAGWGDAAVIIPWRLYENYGDKSVLEENYDMMKKWVEYIRFTAENELPEELENKLKEGKLTDKERERQKYLWNTNFHFGDWLTPSVSFNFETGDVDMIQSAFKTMDIVPTIFYVYSTGLMIKIAEALGKKEDQAYYRTLNEKVKTAFTEEYVDENGYIQTNLQGIYVLALQMGLIPEQLKRNAASRLDEMIKENGGKLDTGFLSVPFLLDVLCDNGYEKAAYDLLFQEECPSWLYEVKMGATTMWEAWQAVLPDGTNTSVSYNHYAFGCVGDWMYRKIGGLDKLEPGYKKILIAPVPDERIDSAETVYQSVYGKIAVSWKRNGQNMCVETVIPANTSARIKLPGGETVETGSGTYRYEYTMQM